MDPIPGQFVTWLPGHSRSVLASVNDVRREDGYKVEHFGILAEKIARLSFANPGMLLLFRGQGQDYKNRAKLTTILPSIFRGKPGTGRRNNHTVGMRFSHLRRGEEALSRLPSFPGIREIRARACCEL
jgi:hypothetical protein